MAVDDQHATIETDPDDGTHGRDGPLGRARARLEALASPTGAYVLRCSRTGDRPVPATDYRFDTRTDARRAAVLVSRYRDHLRRYDPRTPRYDVVVHEHS